MLTPGDAPLAARVEEAGSELSKRVGILLPERFGKCCASEPSAFLLPAMVRTSTIGQSVPRREGAAKVTGVARYTDDLAVPGAWYGKTVRSSIPRGRLQSIRRDPSFDWSRVVVVTAEDIPGENVVHLIRDDQPVLAAIGAEIRHREVPIRRLAAAARPTLEQAASHIEIDYDPAEPILTIDQANEVFSTVNISKGKAPEDVEGVEVVVERSFRVGLQEQLYIEPQAAIAIPEAGGAIRVIGSLQW